MSARDWYGARQRAERLAAALREILREADDLAGIARAIDSSTFAAVLEGSDRGLRSAVADLLDELRDDIQFAAIGFDPDQIAWGQPASPERVALLLSIYHQEDHP